MVQLINKSKKFTIMCLVLCLWLIPSIASAASESLQITNVYPGGASFSQTFTPGQANFQVNLTVHSVSGLTAGKSITAVLQRYNSGTGQYVDVGYNWITAAGTYTYYSVQNGTSHRIKMTTNNGSGVAIYATLTY